MTKSWRTAPLIDLADYLNGYAFKPEDHTDEGLPIIRIEQLKDDSAQLDHYDKSVPEHNRIRNGDLIFSWSASLFLRIWDRGDAILNQHLFKVIPNTDIDKQYLKYCIEYNLPKLANSSHGSTMKHITRKELKRFHVSLPAEKTEQTKIAEILATIDRTIAQTEALIAKHQRIKTGLMQDLLTRGIDVHGQLRHPSTHSFKSTPLGMIPDEWEVYKMEDLTIKIIDGTHHTPNYVDSGIPFVTVKNLTGSNTIDFSDLNYVTEKDHKELIKRVKPCAGDLLVTKDGTLGIARLVEENFPEFSIFVSVALLRPNKRVSSYWLWLFFESGIFEKQLGQLSAGTGLRHIHLEHFRAFKLATPSRDEQDRIMEIINIVQGKIISCTKQLEKLRSLKTGLMQDLLSGKVPVTGLLEG